jgi:choline dehydrogenase-like flavoprotein
MKHSLGLLALLPLVLSASAAIITDPSKLPSKTFDYIIVGGKRILARSSCTYSRHITGGTAGNVVASRLSENSKYSVLVLEAGFDQSTNINVNAPLLCVGLSPGTPLDWSVATCIRLCTETLTWTRAGTTPRHPSLVSVVAASPMPAVLAWVAAALPVSHRAATETGLSKALRTDYMIYNRGSQDDWDYYSRVAGGDASLKWNSMKPYMQKNENFTMPVTTRDVVSNDALYPFESL